MLHSPDIKDFPSVLDVKIVGTSYELTYFCVLYKNSLYAVQIFNWRGDVVRAIVPLSLDIGFSLLLVDEEHNLIISNVKRINEGSLASDEEVPNLYTNYVYSDDGKMQHKWIYKSSNHGWITQALLKPLKRRQTN
ncbi:hypothetical protein LOD99_1996 [Oopsacas minuta]|uniref:Uncharacterized protein n=1 Tax=Oopsacas minuta TaxID=111878 RepID=A0AAV7K2U3_9METZ|nr:hypothetical protein LOD99_1996 [Oopsacas minuta]